MQLKAVYFIERTQLEKGGKWYTFHKKKMYLIFFVYILEYFLNIPFPFKMFIINFLLFTQGLSISLPANDR